MAHSTRITLATVAAAWALTGGLAFAASPVAAAASVRPPTPMNVSATGGDNTAVDSDGTQGSLGSSVQGTVDSDGDQDAFNLTKSEESVPQEKAENKMTK